MHKNQIFNVKSFFLMLVFTCLIVTNSISVIAQTIIDTIELGPESGSGSIAIGVNSTTNRIYVANSCSSIVSVIDGMTNEVIATIAVEDSQMDESRKGVGVNSSTNLIYIVNSASNNVSVIDGFTEEVIDTINNVENHGDIAVNPTTNRIYIPNAISNVIIVIDGSINEVVDTIELEDGAGGVAVNTATNLIYVANSASDNVSVIDGSTNQVIATVEVGMSPRGIEVNPVTNRIYVAASANVRPFSSIPQVGVINVIDGSINEVIATVNTRSIHNGFFGVVLGRVGVNLTTNHIYVIEEGTTDVAGTTEPGSCPQHTSTGALKEGVKVIDGSTNKLIVTDDLGFDGGFGSIDIGVNPNTSLVYVTNGFTGNILVILDEETLTPPDNGKSFTINCKRNFIEGPVFGLEKLVLELGANEDCTLKLTNLETGTPVEISTNLRTGFRSSVKADPIRGVTDANGELEFVISAIDRGTDWVTWVVPNEKGKFEFSKKAYDTGLAWGMLVEVK